MLDPANRELYSEALRPPPGYRFDEGIAATYSLDLTTLLTLPLHLALYAAEESADELLEDGIALLEALRGSAARLSVYCQRGRIHAPAIPRILFALLEPMVIEAVAPAGGAFHPKLWVLRFVGANTSKPPLMRLAILSRNLTSDRCWDLSLLLEGAPTGKPQKGNRELARLVRSLPEMSIATSAGESDRAERLAAEIERTEWDLPAGFTEVRFHALGLKKSKPWRPSSDKRLVVLSPFVTDQAIDELAPMKEPMAALISRPEELAALSDEARSRAGQIFVLEDSAEREDTDDSPEYREPGVPLRGLHAKGYAFSEGWDTHLVVGSANATTAAIVANLNIEILAELIGKRSKVGDPLDLLSPDGFGKMLRPYVHDPALALDEKTENAQRQLEAARDVLASAGLRLRCEQKETGWALVMEPGASFHLEGIDSARAWPVTMKDSHALDASVLGRGESLEFGVTDVAYLTSFLAFELKASGVGEQIRFVLALPVEGLPVEERSASILRSVIRNQDGFIRYLLLLLGGDPDQLGGQGIFRFNSKGLGDNAGLEDVPLLEEMTRAYCRDVPRLRAVRRLIDELGGSEHGEAVVPPDFWAVWAAFEDAMSEKR